MEITTKTVHIKHEHSYTTMYSFNDSINRYIFMICARLFKDINNNKIYQRYLEVYDGIDSWGLQTLGCKTHSPLIDKNNQIDWLSYRFDKLNYPEPLTPEFKKYAQSVLKLQAFT